MKRGKDNGRDVMDAYHTLYRAFGPQHWWPGRTQMEMIVGAILTQNTAWSNVETSIRVLRKNHCLSVKALRLVSEQKLARMIHSSGYFNVKARRIKNFMCDLDRCDQGSLKTLFSRDDRALRERLLATHGIGPETADSIMLYAGGRLSFVIDAYTKRVVLRHGWMFGDPSYDDMREFFMRHVDARVQTYNEYHALIVRIGKEFCLKGRPRCGACPLECYLSSGHIFPSNL